jgi:hypothetical protein
VWPCILLYPGVGVAGTVALVHKLWLRMSSRGVLRRLQVGLLPLVAALLLPWGLGCVRAFCRLFPATLGRHLAPACYKLGLSTSSSTVLGIGVTGHHCCSRYACPRRGHAVVHRLWLARDGRQQAFCNVPDPHILMLTAPLADSICWTEPGAPIYVRHCTMATEVDHTNTTTNLSSMCVTARHKARLSVEGRAVHHSGTRALQKPPADCFAQPLIWFKCRTAVVQHLSQSSERRIDFRVVARCLTQAYRQH